MTRGDLDRRKRQMNRRIRELLAVRRSLAFDGLVDDGDGHPGAGVEPETVGPVGRG